MGIALAPLAVISQVLFGRFLNVLDPSYAVNNSAAFFLFAAFVEEAVKLLAIKLLILNNPEFDEPVDAMIYMITAGLGFAAIENILVIFQSLPSGVPIAFQLWALRFVGATILHALSSGITGYFLGLAWFYRRHSGKLIFGGLALATLFHFAFNYILLVFDNQIQSLAVSLILLIIGGILVSYLFKRIKLRMST